MPNTRTIITKDKLNLDEMSNGDPVAVAIKAYLVDGLDPDEALLQDQEVKVKVQRVNRQGRTVHGVAFRSNQLKNLFESVLEDLGSGRYNIFVEYRKLDATTPPKVVKCLDVEIDDPDYPPLSSRGMVDVGAPQDNGTAINTIALLMQESNKLTVQMMAEQGKNTTAMLTALIGMMGKGSNNSDILKAIETGANLASGPGELPEEEDDLVKLGEFALKVIELVKQGNASPENINAVAAEYQIDPAKVSSAS